ncbi:hypothetical protein BJY00DRAFT_324566 [Aspergillus carlsbadensis]|nr:hypothetical protein BJY00DRAFT_324566 [Aspergillus carlsbadensis]
MDLSLAVFRHGWILVMHQKLNTAIGLHGLLMVKVRLTTDPSKVQQYAEGISKLEYYQAVEDIILKGAKHINPTTLPRLKGPDDGFTSAEKAATKRLMEDLRYGLSPESQRQQRWLWKSLFDMRQAGISKLLFYRTQEFDSYCKTYPQRAVTSLINTVMEWERIYKPHFEQLEYLVTRFIKGDIARRSCLRIPPVAARLTVLEQSWNNASNAWFSADEESSFTLENGAIAFPPDNLGVAFGGRSILQDERDKSIFMLLAPRDNDQVLSVRSLIPVHEGDFLGVTGTLNQMRASRIGDLANVRLHWELFSELGASQPRLLWRVLVKALKTIGPMEELIREATHEDQYLLHQSADYAQRGFINRAL